MALLTSLLSQHSVSSPDAAGHPAIRSLRLAPGQVNPREADEPLGLLLIEDRLLAPMATAVDLVPKLARLAEDMTAEGIPTVRVIVGLYDGTEHRDGEVLLALRSFLADVRASYPRLLGVTLVGRFPHASILRRFPWSPSFDDSVNGVSTNGGRYLDWEPEHVAASADLVLADLTGGWATLYRRRITLPTLKLLPGASQPLPEGLTSGESLVSDGAAWTFTESDYVDVFFVDEGSVTVSKRFPGRPLKALVNSLRSDPEVARSSLTARNPIALPEIAVSRLDAFHAAVQLPTTHNRAGATGRLISGAPLSADGRPQVFRSSIAYQTSDVNGDRVIVDEEFEPDPVLERTLLGEYLDRNHAHRSGRFAGLPRLGVGVTHSFSPDAQADLLTRAIPGIRTSSREASIAGYARSWRQDALIRGITAHSNARISAFGATSQSVVDDALGPAPFRWVARTLGPGRFEYTPTAVVSPTPTNEDPDAVGVGLWVYRTLWRNGRISRQPSLVLHGGCGVSTPDGFEGLGFTDPDFGRFQNAEALLFYTGSLAVMARSKVFNDGPDDFVAELAGGARRLGQAWTRMFRRARDNDPEGADPGEVLARCKKVYPWNLLGDWSLRLLPR